jgi:hypothetical protein
MLKRSWIIRTNILQADIGASWPILVRYEELHNNHSVSVRGEINKLHLASVRIIDAGHQRAVSAVGEGAHVLFWGDVADGSVGLGQGAC